MERRASQEALNSAGQSTAGRRPLFGYGRKVWLAVLALAGFAGLLVVYMYGFLEIDSIIRPAVEEPAPMGDLPENTLADVDTTLKQQPPRFKRCSDLPIPEHYWNMTIESTPAFVDVPQASKINVGESVCVRVVVPAKPLGTAQTFVPLSNAPWDSVLVDLVGRATNVSVPVPLRMANHTHNQNRDLTHVYEADVVLRDADIYSPEGYIEFRYALWNPEASLDPQPFEPEKLQIPDTLQVNVSDDDGVSPYSLQNYLDLPLCTEPNAEGRWISAASLPFDAAQVPPPDNHNLVWLPYDCRLKRVKYQDFATCLAQRYPKIHWFGDSNTRRALKKVSTLGQWCAAEPNSLVCTCNDNSEKFTNYGAYKRISPFDLDPVAGGAVAPDGAVEPPANRSRIVAFKWDGLTTRNDPPWADYFTQDFEAKLGHPSLAIVGVTNWDTAFETHAFFSGEVDKLAALIDASYPTHLGHPNTDIVLRSGQYYCCTSDMDKFWKRRYSRLRNRFYDATLIDTFKQKLDGKRNVLVWDVAQISERRPYKYREEDVTKCAANHVRSEIVEIENQVLMNALCNSGLEA
ncbi:hypothetical protein LPJ70_000402 [Coemansia sp. RSA 2708]|nr:hypothetical protein LPJ70_000402 [Coemansia sp. RSA 2708]